MPSDFDANYAYALGGTAAAIVGAGRAGYMAVVSELAKPAEEWHCRSCAVYGDDAGAETSFWPREANLFERSVDVRGSALKLWQKSRMACAEGELYTPGPIQLSGPAASFLSIR